MSEHKLFCLWGAEGLTSWTRPQRPSQRPLQLEPPQLPTPVANEGLQTLSPFSPAYPHVIGDHRPIKAQRNNEPK